MGTPRLVLGVIFLLVIVGFFVVKDKNNDATSMLTLTSPSFTHNGSIPSRFTCDGENSNPELHIGNVPEGTQSLVLLVDDPDIPDMVKQSRGIEKFDHWVLYNIPADTKVIPEGSNLGSEGLNSAGDAGYRGPCPPTEYEPTEHRYIFRLYALSTANITFVDTPTLDHVKKAFEGHVLESVELIGLYDRKK